MDVDFGVLSDKQSCRPRKWDGWQIIDGILYVDRTGCQWRMMPKDLPAW
jgi:transposase